MSSDHADFPLGVAYLGAVLAVLGVRNGFLVGAPRGAAFVPVSLETLWGNLGQVPIIASAVVQEASDVGHWGPLWLAIPGRRGGRARTALPPRTP